MFRHLVISCVLSLVLAGGAHAQGTGTGAAPGQSPPHEPGFLTNYTFHLNAAHFATDDKRFTWDSDLGGDIDLVDYGMGRLNFLANYKAVLGEEFRKFDLNQGSYTLDFRVSLRSARNEVAGVFHHVSRHLSDRPRPFAIDWNMLGLDYWQQQHLGKTAIRVTGRALFTIERSYVDYLYEIGGQLNAERPLRRNLNGIGSLGFTVIGVDKGIRDRGTQNGGRVELGIQLPGEAGAVELFLAFERRIDAHPVDLRTLTWALAGFRLLSR